MMGSIFNFRLGSNAGLFTSNFLGTLTIFLMIWLLTTLVMSACVCLYFKEYDRARADELPITRSIISPSLAGASWRLFYNLLILALIMIVATLLIAGVCAVLFIIPVLNVLVGIALVIGMIIIFPVLIYLIYAANFIIIRDEVLVTDAISKAWRYLKGNFWWTWLLMVAASISVGVAASIFSIPISIITFARAFARLSDPSTASEGGSMLIIIFGALSAVAQLLFVSPVLYTFCVFNFYNNEERHEGTGLMSRIDEIDKI
jgi:hypothetical protein